MLLFQCSLRSYAPKSLTTFGEPYLFFQRSLRGCEPCDRHSVWRAADIIKSDFMTECNRLRFPAMLAAYSYFKIFPDLSSFFHSHAHKRPDAFLVNSNERIFFQYAALNIKRQEPSCIVSGQSINCLSKIVRSKRKEIGVFRNLVGCHAGTRQFYHCPHRVLDFDFIFFLHAVCSRNSQCPEPLKFIHMANKGDHDLGSDLYLLPGKLAGGFHNGLHLHLVYFRISNAEPAAAVPQHRIKLMQKLILYTQSLKRNPHFR